MEPLLLAFSASVCLGVTAVLLKQAHVDSTLYGLAARSVGSLPAVTGMALLVGRPLLELLRAELLLTVVVSVVSIIGADLVLMWILRKKPVGMIAPLMAVFPLFTTVLLLASGMADFSATILLLTSLIVAGVAMVTYKPQSDPSFDTEALAAGLAIALLLGVTNFADVVAIATIDSQAGLAYTALKFGAVALFSLTLFSATGGLPKLEGYLANRSSTVYLLLAGMLAWGAGSFLLYSAYGEGDAQLVNAVIGTNPIFAVVVSLGLGMEEMSWRKTAGLLLCVVASVGLANLP